MQLEHDPRFLAAIAQFNAGELYEAADAFEELFFETVRDEVELVRVFLQVSVGAYHAETGQRRPAIERLEEALLAADRVTDDHGLDLRRLCDDTIVLMKEIAAGRARSWPRVRWRDAPDEPGAA